MFIKQHGRHWLEKNLLPNKELDNSMNKICCLSVNSQWCSETLALQVLTCLHGGKINFLLNLLAVKQHCVTGPVSMIRIECQFLEHTQISKKTTALVETTKDSQPKLQKFRQWAPNFRPSRNCSSQVSRQLSGKNQFLSSSCPSSWFNQIDEVMNCAFGHVTRFWPSSKKNQILSGKLANSNGHYFAAFYQNSLKFSI